MRLLRLGQLLGGWPRRLLAIGCLVLAGISAVHARPASAPTEATSSTVVVAAHNVEAGAVITTADVRMTRWPTAVVPPSAIEHLAGAIGHRLTGPIATGEVITPSRLVGANLGAGLPAGLIAVPVPLVDSGAANLIHAGDHVDLLSPPSATNPQASVVAAGVLVLSIVPGDPAATSISAQLVVAVDQATELRIAQAITVPLLATLINPP
jgi:pilus assembly protein CpaB